MSQAGGVFLALNQAREGKVGRIFSKTGGGMAH